MTKASTNQELLTEATTHINKAYKLITQVKMKLALFNKIFHEDERNEKTMTTKYLNTTGVMLYKIEGETYCKMMDIVKMIQHEISETNDKNVKDILDRMEMRLTKNDFLLKDAIKPQVIRKKSFPGRYAVGYYDTEGTYHFYKGTVNNEDIFTTKPCKAKLFTTYRDASACSDFLDEDTMVLDWEANMTEEERWQRELNMPFPYDADEGFEHSVPVEVVR